LRFRDHGGAVREAGLKLGDLNVRAVLQCEFDGVFQGEGDDGWTGVLGLRRLLGASGKSYDEKKSEAEQSWFRAWAGLFCHSGILI
jgi:hypothetical protein